ncbi:MAG: hypothetical protein K2I10_02205, partial [Lachnospiraceae bacterium]|nr:hypothetical protein [Lachnospiraceae bacterium]
TTLFNVKVTYESETVESGITYLGNIAPGITGNVDSMLTGIAPDMGEGIVKAVITYEDEAGNEMWQEQTFETSILSLQSEKKEEDDDTGQWWLIMAVIVMILSGTGVFFAVKRTGRFSVDRAAE